MADGKISPNLAVTWLSFAVSLVAMLASAFYLVRFIYLSRGQQNGVLRNALNARRAMFGYIFILFTLLFGSDICSVYVNMNSDGVKTSKHLVNQVGQLAMAIQLIAMALHLTLWSIWILTRIRRNLAKIHHDRKADLPDQARQAILHSRTVTVSLFLSMIIAIFILGVTLKMFDEVPYVIQIALRIYFLSYIHYLLTMRAIMKAHREMGEIKTWNAGGGGGGSDFMLTETNKRSRGMQRESVTPLQASGGEELEVNRDWAYEQFEYQQRPPPMPPAAPRSVRGGEVGWALRDYPEQPGSSGSGGVGMEKQNMGWYSPPLSAKPFPTSPTMQGHSLPRSIPSFPRPVPVELGASPMPYQKRDSFEVW
ncbi:hypothetical protein HDV00_009187 [Rhizophlyctis rosea]|nr:hypothetical protein HDV00_009187 [Rhizophlyctis rosea]